MWRTSGNEFWHYSGNTYGAAVDTMSEEGVLEFPQHLYEQLTRWEGETDYALLSRADTVKSSLADGVETDVKCSDEEFYGVRIPPHGELIDGIEWEHPGVVSYDLPSYVLVNLPDRLDTRNMPLYDNPFQELEENLDQYV